MNISAGNFLKVLIAALLLISAAGLMDGKKASANAADHTLNVAHRGASGYAPENTMAAFDRAFEMKADFIEIDVHMSADGEVVAIHDLMVDRTTNGSGRVSDFTLEELKQLDAGSWFGPEFAGEQIPTLEEILDAYRGKIGILIEIKDPSAHPGIEDAVAAALAERNMDKPNNGKIIVQSFDHGSVAYFNSLLPNIPTGVLVGNLADGISDEALAQFATYADYFNPNHRMVDAELVERVQAHGLKIAPYTINDQTRVNELIDNGVDGIISDFPDLISHTGQPQ
ncbi:glycerophosphodiester phosphodiesterase [Salinicoccus halitifaciens]|uniref:Glycerophosphoryl diester phosphodiesterase n=1 Tax=Salinicoccus halitifaciens TaxID=1073415 RepID=A0ABV2EC97_9STAP|nr:glycerophosphodiester phosphodiesterase family protein [Salinicoccus halitifaciens]MCD2137518.1 glycerophosphodiester phosphodiesterase [Salinicoccus halitifaciens]